MLAGLAFLVVRRILTGGGSSSHGGGRHPQQGSTSYRSEAEYVGVESPSSPAAQRSLLIVPPPEVQGGGELRRDGLSGFGTFAAPRSSRRQPGEA